MTDEGETSARGTVPTDPQPEHLPAPHAETFDDRADDASGVHGSIGAGVDLGAAPRGIADRAFRTVATGCGMLILLTLGMVVLFLILRAWPAVAGPHAQVASVYEALSGGKAHGFWQYVGPLMFGTVLIAGLALLIAFFVAVAAALFIVFYAPKRLSVLLNYVVDLLAAIPSVIYGLWGALVFVPATYGFWAWLSKYFGWIPLFAGPAANPSRTVAACAVVLAVMILPIITSMTRDLFMQAPQLTREAALALGATKWEMLKLTALPFARSGMVSASMLGLGRALGETMAVMMILSPGMTYSWHVLQASKSQTIAANIAAQYPEADPSGVSALIATGLVLFVITFAVNFIARRITVGGKRPSRKPLFRRVAPAPDVRAKDGSAPENTEAAQYLRLKEQALGAGNDVSNERGGNETGCATVDAVAANAAERKQTSPASTRPTPDFSRFKPTSLELNRRKLFSAFVAAMIAVAFIVAMIPLFSLLFTTFAHGLKRLNLNFLSYNMSGVIGGLPTPSGGYGGIEHAIIGTLEVTGGAMLISVPVGLMCAIYLTEYARGGRFSKAVSMLVDVMSGIPSVVAGLFAFSLFTLLGGPGVSNGFEGSVALSILMIPTVVNSSVQMLRVVPQDLREASYALGVTKSRTIVHVVLRTALPGIVSGVILAIARVIGETAPLLLTAGFIATTNLNLFAGQMTTLPVYVYQEYSKMSVTCLPKAGTGCVTNIPTERAWAAALALIIIVLALNLAGRLVQRLLSVETSK
jgi:phosphate transport system permease protein